MDWTEKYRPESVDEIVGNEEKVERVREWLRSPDVDRPLILYGPPGVGKTSIGLALARDEGYEIQELNAGEERTGDVLKERFVEVGKSRSYHGRSRLILLDEADTLDEGGISAVTHGIHEATEPIIIVTNDYYDGIPRRIREECEAVEFEPVDGDAMLTRLEEICEAEGIEYTTDALVAIARNADGDVRSAIRDLQSAVRGLDTDRRITLEKVHETFGIMDTDRIVFVGEDDANPTAVWRALDMVFDGVSESRWIIPMAPGFELVVGEYAARSGITYDVRLPCHYPEVVEVMGWDIEDRLGDVIAAADNVLPVYQPAEMDAFEYEEFYRWVYIQADAVYGWIAGERSERVDVGWGYPGGGIDRLNLASI